MIGTSFMDEIDCGNFFDNMDDLLEFPPNDDAGIVGSNKLRATIGDYCDAFSNSIWDDPAAAHNNSPENTLAVAGVSDSVFSGAHNHPNSAADLSAELSLPYEDIVQLEWLSTFVEDSFSAGGMTMKKDTRSSYNQFQTSSPVSVLESSGSSNHNAINAGANAAGTLPVCHEKRARSKRPRPPTFTPKPYMHLMVSSPDDDHSSRPPLFVPNSSYEPLKRAKKTKHSSNSSSSSTSTTSSSSSSSRAAEAQPKKKTTKIRILPPSPNAEKPPLRIQDQNEDPNPSSLLQQQGGPVRKCLHCQITKTPQWRAGPLGPKTLCNACGVRYKSGRLFPEYRPAASPTFVPALHSNSHKKVLEMRSKGTDVDEAGSGGERSVVTYLQGEAAACVPEAGSSQAELIPKSNLLPDYI